MYGLPPCCSESRMKRKRRKRRRKRRQSRKKKREKREKWVQPDALLCLC
jgi:hypothetical protein